MLSTLRVTFLQINPISTKQSPQKRSCIQCNTFFQSMAKIVLNNSSVICYKGFLKIKNNTINVPCCCIRHIYYIAAQNIYFYNKICGRIILAEGYWMPVRGENRVIKDEMHFMESIPFMFLGS